VSADLDLDAAIGRAYEELLAALDLEQVEDRNDAGDRFRAGSEQGRFERIFGGQLLAQAVVAAGRTAPGRAPDSLHACFVGAGRPEMPLDLAVTRVRDGRSVATRGVEISQDGQPLLVAMASFPTPEAGGAAALPCPPPEVPPPDAMPPIQQWAAAAAAAATGVATAPTWIERPPAVALRIGEPTYFLGGSLGVGPRSHWMRAGGDAGTDALLQAALLAYASDYFLLDMAFRSHPARLPMAELHGLSLDHAIWFHRPVAFDGWHLHTQDLVALAGERGLVRGAIHDARGDLVASVAQAVLVRVRSRR
jgi:acyl-CoA thioesterase-2